MDNIRQYQQLSDIKPSYQSLILPYYSVGKIKIQHNNDELELYYKGLGLWGTGIAGSAQKKEKKEKIIFISFLDEF